MFVGAPRRGLWSCRRPRVRCGRVCLRCALRTSPPPPLRVLPQRFTTFPSGHEDFVHDAAYDYYGRRLATVSSDQAVKVCRSRLLFAVSLAHEWGLYVSDCLRAAADLGVRPGWRVAHSVELEGRAGAAVEGVRGARVWGLLVGGGHCGADTAGTHSLTGRVGAPRVRSGARHRLIRPVRCDLGGSRCGLVRCVNMRIGYLGVRGWFRSWCARAALFCVALCV
jgi:hypothetical protein